MSAMDPQFFPTQPTSSSSSSAAAAAAAAATMSNDSPPSTPGPSQLNLQQQTQAQNRLLNRVSTLFGGGKKKAADNGASSSSTAPAIPENDGDDASLAPSQADSVFGDERNDSCVDSMYSSIRSRRSNYPPVPNPNTPPPLRTVQLDSPIVHLPTPPPKDPPKKTAIRPTSASSSTSTSSIPHTPSPAVEQRNETPSDPSLQKIQDVEKQFELLLKEYAPSADHISSVNSLTIEQKEMLLRSSKSLALLNKNSTFSNVFSLKTTFGIKNKKSRGNSVDQQQFFNTVANSRSFASEVELVNGNAASAKSGSSKTNDTTKANTAPGRYIRTRVALPRLGSSNSIKSHGKNTSRSKWKSTPEYFVHMLQETPARELEDSEVLDLRVFLRSVVVSWTSEFLDKGGYQAIADLFRQMKEKPKRSPKDDRYSQDQKDNRILEHLGKCLKTIMTHQSKGTQIVLTDPSALCHIRDILFGPASKKQKQVSGLEISTKSLLLNLMCTLATIQTTRTCETEYVHGYDVLRRLLLDRPSDTASSDEDDKKSQPKHISPFPTTLKTDPQEILQMIMENDPNGSTIGREYEWNRDELKPRYTSWMRELECTVEKHIEKITFLANVFGYPFQSAYRQIHARQTGGADPSRSGSGESGAVMTEEGVVDYIITHLRLIRTIVTTQPTSYTGNYDEREQEKMRLELMLSGFDKISKVLIQCPHPLVHSSYINYLKPLLNPCADLSAPSGSTANPDDLLPPPLPARNQQPAAIASDAAITADSNEDDENDYEILVYADNDLNEPLQHHLSPRRQQQLHEQAEEGPAVVTQWGFASDPDYDQVFYDDDEYLDDHFNTDDEYEDGDQSNISGSRLECASHSEENDSIYSAHDRQHFTTSSTKIVDLGATSQHS
ncbi:armadillo-type protein [Parasitella parasitica]|nr:armadillo-type protein [Parasitella parasitica]